MSEAGPKSFDQKIVTRQHGVDLVSFFVDGKLFDELSGHEVRRHNLSHLANVVAKLTRGIHRAEELDISIIQNEVVPDLIVYALQTAFSANINWLTTFADNTGLSTVDVQSFDELMKTHTDSIEEFPTELNAVLTEVQKRVIEASSSLARVSDKRDHGEALPSVDLGRDVITPFMTSAMDLAHHFGMSLDELYMRRLEDIKAKYGNVRILLGGEGRDVTPDKNGLYWSKDPDKEPHIVDTYGTLLRSQRENPVPYKVTIAGQEFVVLPNVFPSSYYNDTEFFAQELPIDEGDEFLEVGSGTGIISVVAAQKGANVTATDINPDAVQNTRINAALHAVDINVIKSDVFEEIPDDEKFDKIFWNVPFGYVTQELTDLERSVYDKEYLCIERFIKGAKSKLKPGGKLYIGFSSDMGRRDVLDRFIDEAGASDSIEIASLRHEGRTEVLHFEIIQVTF